jgi:hypothetical protein
MKGKCCSLVASVTFAALLLGPSSASAQASLGSAQSFAVLGSSTVTNTGSSTINGNVGVSTVGGITGFPPGIVTGGTIHNNDAVATTAQADATTAYNNLAALSCNHSFGPGDQDLTLLSPLTPGVYCFASSASLTGALVLDALSDPSAQFVFKIGSTLITSPGSSVSVINGGSPCNVFWQVGSSATLDVGTTFIGNVLAKASITLNTSARIVSGRALAQTAAVTLDTNHIDSNACLVPNTGACVSGFDCSSGLCNLLGECAPCASGLDCTSPESCVSGTCCIPSGTSCGGDCLVQCATGGACTTASDCTSGFCTGGLCAPCTGTGDCGGNLCVSGVCGAAPAPTPPTLSKRFSPSVINKIHDPTLTITLCNPNSSPANLIAPLTDTLPDGVVIAATPNASTTCGGGTVTATAGGSTIILPAGSSIPASACCTVSVNVIPTRLGPFVNTLPINALRTTNGNNTVGFNTVAATATLTVLNVPTLSGWAIIMLPALLALVGFAAMRRQTT